MSVERTTHPDRWFWRIWEGLMWSTIITGLAAAGYLLCDVHYG